MGRPKPGPRASLPRARSSECSGVITKPAAIDLERAKQRDHAALVAFFGRYERGLFAYFSGPMHWHWSYVPDLVQETITRAIKAFPDFRGDSPEQAERWLFGIARNVHLQEVSRQVGIRLRQDVAAELARFMHRPAELAQLSDILAALGELPLGQLEVLRLWLEGHTIREIAGELDLPDGTVATRIHRARRRLRERLGLRVDDEP
jgi:RNA polymerase sigma-70 factor (ECF subfamily)